MQNFNKECFIYTKHFSISNVLCEDIISLFENELTNSNFVKTSIPIPNTENWKRINSYLTIELRNNLHIYSNKINKPFFADNEKGHDFVPLNTKIINKKKEYVIDKYHYKEHDTILNKKHEKLNDGVNDSVLRFIWYLNDVDGEISFWNAYNIKPKQGTLIIFPVSWCFPYSEVINSENVKYTVNGYIKSFWEDKDS